MATKSIFSIAQLFRLSVWTKSCSIAIIISIILPQLIWTFEGHNYSGRFSNQSNLIHLDKPIKIPDQLGVIKENFQGSSKTIISIQDLHCNYEVQKNIAGIIDYLHHEFNLNLIGEEGAVDEVNTDIFRSFPLTKIREQVADYYVKQGKLTGAEFITITHEDDLKLVGIESKEFYDQSLALVHNFLNAETQGLIFDLVDNLDHLKSKLYNRQLLTYDQFYRQYKLGDITLIGFVRGLKGYIEKTGVDATIYPEFYKVFSNKTRPTSRPINHDLLADELANINMKIQEKLMNDSSESQLAQLSHYLSIIEKLLNISVTTEELTLFRENRQLFKVQQFIKFISRYKQDIDLESDLFKLDHYLNQVEQFYDLADKRSQIFVHNLLSEMDEQQESLAIMINGGFHSQQIMDEIKKHGISLVMIKPNVTKLDIINPYFSLLQGKQLPIEKLLEKNQTILAMKSWLQSSSMLATIELAFDPQLLAQLPKLNSSQRKQINKWLSTYNIYSVQPLERPLPEPARLSNNYLLCQASRKDQTATFPVVLAKHGRFSKLSIKRLKENGGALAASNVIAFSSDDWPMIDNILSSLNQESDSIWTAAARWLKQRVSQYIYSQDSVAIISQLIKGDFQFLFQQVSTRSGKTLILIATHFIETGFVVLPVVVMAMLIVLAPLLSVAMPIMISLVLLGSLLWINYAAEIITERRHQQIITPTAPQGQSSTQKERQGIKRDFQLQGLSALLVALIMTQQPSAMLGGEIQLIDSVLLGFLAWIMGTTLHGVQSAYAWKTDQGLRVGTTRHTKKTDVMLTYLAGIHDEERVDEPLSISVLAGYLDKEFDEKLTISTNHFRIDGVDKIMDDIERERPRVLGISLFYQSLPDLHQIMEKVREMAPEDRPQVVLGNAIAANDYQWLLQRYPEVLVCFGEGEQTMVDVVNYVNGKKNITDVANIAYSNKQHQVKRTRPPVVTDMKQLGLPRRDLLSKVIKTRGVVNLEITRDCHYNCAICARAKYYGSKQKREPRFRELDDIMTDIIQVCKNGVKTVNFVDEDLMSASPEWLLQFAERIVTEKKAGKIPDDFSFFTSISVRSVYNPKGDYRENIMRERALLALRDAGLSFVFIGIESGSAKQLKRYGKFATVADNKKAIAVLDRLGIGIAPGFIMFDPKATLAELRQNIAFLRETGIANKVGYVVKNYIPLKHARTTQNLIKDNLVDALDYDPNYGAYEWFFAHEDTARVFYAIKEWEESQHDYLWQLKLIRRGTDFSSLSPGGQSKILEWIDHENDFMLGFLEALVQDVDSANHDAIVNRYSNRWIQHVINVDTSLREDKSIPLYQDRLQSKIYEGIVREYIRRLDQDIVMVSRSNLINEITSRYRDVDLNRLTSAFDKLIDLEELRGNFRINLDHFSIEEKFWHFKKVTFHERPRPALGMDRDEMVKMRARIGVSSSVRIGHELPVTIGASWYWFKMHSSLRVLIRTLAGQPQDYYDFNDFKRQAHWVENNYIWLLISFGIISLFALTTGNWQELGQQLLSFEMINDVKRLSMAGWLGLFLGAHFNKGTPIPNQIAAVKIMGLIMLAHLLPLPFLVVVPWATYLIHDFFNRRTIDSQHPILTNRDLAHQFQTYIQSHQKVFNESPYDPVIGQTLEKYKERLFGEFNFIKNLYPRLGLSFSLALTRADQLTLVMPRWAWQLLFTNHFITSYIIKTWLNMSLWSMSLRMRLDINQDPVLIHHQILLRLKRSGNSSLEKTMAKVAHAVAGDKQEKLTATEKLISNAYQQVLEKQDTRSRRLLMLRIWRLIDKKQTNGGFLSNLKYISQLSQQIGGFSYQRIKIRYQPTAGQMVTEELALPLELINHRFIGRAIKTNFIKLNIHYDRVPLIPDSINLFRLLENAA